MKNILYLGSQSRSRQKLLDAALIPYTVLKHDSNEDVADPTLPFHEYVLAIAHHKMEHLLFPNLPVGKKITVLTADTLMRTQKSKQILGKPDDMDHARQMIRLVSSEPIELETACVLEKKERTVDGWITTAQTAWTTPAIIEFCIPDDEIDLYLEKAPHALYACGAGIVEDFGSNYLKSISGSYSSVIGLPLFELRHELKKINSSVR